VDVDVLREGGGPNQNQLFHCSPLALSQYVASASGAMSFAGADAATRDEAPVGYAESDSQQERSLPVYSWEYPLLEPQENSAFWRALWKGDIVSTEGDALPEAGGAGDARTAVDAAGDAADDARKEVGEELGAAGDADETSRSQPQRSSVSNAMASLAQRPKRKLSATNTPGKTLSLCKAYTYIGITDGSK